MIAEANQDFLVSIIKNDSLEILRKQDNFGKTVITKDSLAI